MKPSPLRVLCLAGLCFFALDARAVLREIDLTDLGDGKLTLDTESSLEWLDLTLTVNRSFNDISGALGAGGEFAGFRYATHDEVALLFAQAGITIAEGVGWTDRGEVPNVQYLLGLVGQTGLPEQGFPGPATRGIYGQVSSPGRHYYGTTSINGSGTLAWLRLSLGPLEIDDAATNAATGSFLVRTSTRLFPDGFEPGEAP